jgi:hypothetical protein
VGLSKNEGRRAIVDDVGWPVYICEMPEPEDTSRQKELRKFAVKKGKLVDLRADAAAGLDGIGPRVLKELGSKLALALADILTTSMEEGVVPKTWKEANLTPVFKKGAKSSLDNYDLSHLCKVQGDKVCDTR